MKIRLIKTGRNLRSPVTKTQTFRWIAIGKHTKDAYGISQQTHTTPIEASRELEASNRKEKEAVFSDFKDQFFSSCTVKCRMMGASHLME